jgi:mono/diheme cytochrome c family protein
MPAWKPLAFVVVVSSLVALVTGGFAATEASSDVGAPLSSRASLKVAQASDSPSEATAGDQEGGAPTGSAGTTTAPGEQTTAGGEVGDEGPAVFTEAYLKDSAHHELGKVVWETCTGCHGARSYPGKAPKLRPKRYTPDFVFDRVTNGYKKMPAWKDVFTKEERMAVVAYILSDDFSP